MASNETVRSASAKSLAATEDEDVISLPIRDFGLVSMAELEKRGVQPVGWDIEGLLETLNGPLLVTGAPAAFKSWFIKLAMIAAVTGNDFLGHFPVKRTRPCGVLVNLDAGAVALENRVPRLGVGLPPNCYVTTWDRFDWERAEELHSAYRGSHISYDCLSAMHVLGESNEDPAEAMGRFLRRLRALYAKYDCNGFLADHLARVERTDAESYSGTVQKKVAIRQGITLKVARKEAGRAIVRAGCVKMSEAEEFLAFEVAFAFVDGVIVPTYIGSAAEKATQVQCDVESVIAAMRSDDADAPWKFNDLMKKSGLTRDALYAALDDGVDKFLFARTGKGPATRYCLATHVDKNAASEADDV